MVHHIFDMDGIPSLGSKAATVFLGAVLRFMAEEQKLMAVGTPPS